MVERSRQELVETNMQVLATARDTIFGSPSDCMVAYPDIYGGNHYDPTQGQVDINLQSRIDAAISGDFIHRPSTYVGALVRDLNNEQT